jgi:hypothetical protein
VNGYLNRSVDEHEFRMSFYGLPEPVGAEWKDSTATFYWLFVGAGVFLIIALAFGYRRRQRKSA